MEGLLYSAAILWAVWSTLALFPRLELPTGTSPIDRYVASHWGRAEGPVIADGDRNLMLRLSQLTDEEVFECPLIFMSDVGTIGIDPEEAERLRLYLEQGGFLWADDFWGSRRGRRGRTNSASRFRPRRTQSSTFPQATFS